MKEVSNSNLGKNNNSKKKLTGDALVNKVALIVVEIICAAIIFGYISDYITKNSTLVYFLCVEASSITTFVAVLVAYFKKPEKLKYVASMCFSVVYFIATWGASLDVAFVMAFPIAVVFILYYDRKLIKMLTITFNIIVVIDVINIVFILKKLHSGTPVNSSHLLMEFLGMTIFLFAIRTITDISIQNNEDKLNAIKSVSDKVNESIKEINGELGALDESAVVVKQAMEEINAGMSSAVNAVQQQLYQTEAIQNRILNVSEAANNIKNNVNTTLVEVANGNNNVEGLVESSDVSVSISETVTKDLNELKERIEAMNSITKIIESIAFQTNIMALNANVEAARAGQSGRGFAVVASEISRMAAKTKEATDEISGIIENVMSSLKELVSSVEKMAEVIRNEKQETRETSEIFVSIRKYTEEVQNQVGLFMEYIDGLTSANGEIVQSVQTISATTEEVSALTTNAMNREMKNVEVVGNIAKQVKELAENAQ